MSAGEGQSASAGNSTGNVIQQGKPSGPPHEGSRETWDGIITSVPKDYCWTPAGSGYILIGYKITAKQREATNLANSVTQTSLRSHVKGSIINRCDGDDKGTGGGFFSHTHNAECTPMTWSETVTFEGRNAVRDSDLWWMNHRNTWGMLDYKKDMKQYPTDDPKQIEAKLYLAQYAGPSPAAAAEGPAGAAAVAAPMAGRAAVALGKGVSGALPGLEDRILHNTINMVILTARLQQTLSNIVRTSTNNNPCPYLEARIRAHMAEAQWRRDDLLDDANLHNLFTADHNIDRPPFGSWNGHIDRYNTEVSGIQNAILMAKFAGCKIPPGAYLYLTLKTPSAPR